MSKESGVYQACASCKHQRKKCDDNCELAPYFPASRFREFQNAHRLFGVSNIQKIIASVEPHQRKAAAESILMEANYRRSDPVNGCLGVCRTLNSHIVFYEKQLKIANQQLALFRQREKLDSQRNHFSISNNYSSMSSIPSEKSSLNLHDHQFDVLQFPAPLLSDMVSICISEIPLFNYIVCFSLCYYYIYVHACDHFVLFHNGICCRPVMII